MTKPEPTLSSYLPHFDESRCHYCPPENSPKPPHHASTSITNNISFGRPVAGSEADNRLGDSLNGNHSYQIDTSANSNHLVGINGLNFLVPIGQGVNITVDGGAGRDVLTAIGSGGADAVVAQQTTLRMSTTTSATSYQLIASNMEDTTTSATGSNDTMTLIDRPNAADHFFSDLNDASVTSAILYGLDNSYRNAAIGFSAITAQRSSSPGTGDAGDVAIMRDGPASGDAINVAPGTATMTYANGLGTSRATGYNVVHTYSDNGNDTANFADTTGNDTYYADRRVNHQNSSGANRTGFAFLNDGGSTLFFAGGYWSNNGTANAGNDTAILYDGPLQDQFTATPTSIRMVGGGSSFDNMATGFDNNYGYSDRTTGGGPNTDLATYLDSSSNDTFIVGSFNAWMQYPAATTYVTGFYNTTANSTAGGVDIANMFDSNGNDTLTPTPTVHASISVKGL